MRISNPKLLKRLKGEPCIICDKPGEAHHVKTKGSGGDDVPDNLMQLCREHHTEIHTIGRDTFFTRHKEASHWAKKHNWIKDKFYQYKWMYVSSEGIIDDEF